MSLRVVSKVGRNAPCPCGSGEKFKRCCLGKKIEPSAPGARGAGGSLSRARLALAALASGSGVKGG